MAFIFPFSSLWLCGCCGLTLPQSAIRSLGRSERDEFNSDEPDPRRPRLRLELSEPVEPAACRADILARDGRLRARRSGGGRLRRVERARENNALFAGRRAEDRFDLL